jgi:putative spermidine/putrescine transport system permease protein
MPFLRRWPAFWLLAPALVLLVALLLLPLVYLLQYSALDGDFMTGDIAGPTLANYRSVLSDPFFLSIVGKTFLISFLVSCAALVTGFPLAALIWRAGSAWRSPLTILVLSPLLVSMVASSYGWIVILGTNGLINTSLQALGITSEPIKLLYTNLAIGIGLLHVTLPFMVLSLVASLDRIDGHLSEAAGMLGANRFQTWRHILIPLCIPGVGAGFTLTFALSISAYVTPAVLGPNGPNFITTLIYQNFINLYEWGLGATMATFLLVVSLLVVLGLGTFFSRLGPQQRRAA